MENKTVLIVDDDPDIANIIAIVLQMAGYTTKKASTGNECLDCVKEERPSLILLDLMLPDMDGSKVAKLLRENKLTKEIPIVVVSASRNIERIVQEIPINDYIEKPFEISHLVTTVTKYLPTRFSI